MFFLPDLPFAKDALADFCSAEGFEYHHGKHHAAYVSKLNAALEKSDLAHRPLVEIIRRSYAEKNMAIFNNAAQHFNHDFFWKSLSPTKTTANAELSAAIDRDFGDMKGFQKEFTTKASTLFGSGWTWLVKNTKGTLEIIQTANAETPITKELTPILTLDVWEHAYYIDHRNARPNFIASFFAVINWNFANRQFSVS